MPSVADAHPSRPIPLDEHLVRLEDVPVDLEAAALELGEAARGERGRDLAELLPELGSKHPQVRLDPELGGLDLAELDALDP